MRIVGRLNDLIFSAANMTRLSLIEWVSGDDAKPNDGAGEPIRLIVDCAERHGSEGLWRKQHRGVLLRRHLREFFVGAGIALSPRAIASKD